MYAFIPLLPEQLQARALQLSDQQLADIVSAALIDSDVKTPSKAATPYRVNPVMHAPSAKIGLSGEDAIGSILGKYTTINTAKAGKAGDLIINTNAGTILVEVKKYKTTVPQTEVDKFHRDINSNGSLCGGIMISISSNIVGHRNVVNLSHHYTNGIKIPVVFLILSELDEKTGRNCVWAAIEILEAAILSTRHIDVLPNIAYVIEHINSQLDLLSQCRRALNETQSMLNTQFSRLIESIITAEVNIKSATNLLHRFVVHHEAVPASLDTMEIKTTAPQYELLSMLLDNVPITVCDGKIVSADKKVSIKVLKTKMVVYITTAITSGDIPGVWTYNGKVLSVELTGNTLDYIKELI